MARYLTVLRERAIAAELSAEQVKDWANAIEGRDDIEFDPQDEKAVADAIFLLANPEINFPITESLALKMKDELEQKATQAQAALGAATE